MDAHLTARNFRTGYKYGKVQFTCHVYIMTYINKMGMVLLTYWVKET